MKIKPIAVIFLLFSVWEVVAQRTGATIGSDTIPVVADTAVVDTVLMSDTLPPQLPYRISADAIDAPIHYQAADSLVFDLPETKMILYNRANIRQRDIMLTAGYIEIDWTTNILLAHTVPDSAGIPSQRPEMTESDQQFKGDTIQYNFQTRRGLIAHVSSTYNDLYVLSRRIKYYGKDAEGRDNDIVFGENAIFTTCDHPEPHYGIRSRKQKVIPDKLVVVGPSNLEIANVPTPVWLPFGFFPISKGQRNGIIFPREFENSPVFGLGVRNTGYYFGFGEYLDVTLTGDIYSRGSWGVQSSIRYNKRYAYNGNFQLGYSLRQVDEPGTPDFSRNRSFLVRWNHAQAANAHPTRSFSGNINLQTDNYLSLNNNDAGNVLNNQLGSNVTFNQLFPGSPFSLTASMSHSQNTATRQLTLQLPVVDFRMNQIYPFRRTERAGVREAWYEKIGVGYNMRATNEIRTTDTTFFQPQMFEDMRYGIRHTPTVSASYNVFRHFRFTPTVNYNERWYYRTTEKVFDPTPVIRIDTIFPDDDSEPVIITDTISYGTITDQPVYGFRSVREFSAGASLSTMLFGTANFRRGRLRALRHTITPSINYTFSPNYLNPIWNYFDSVQVDSRFDDKMQYSYFEQTVFGGPPAAGLRSSVGFNILNVFEGKWRRRGPDGKMEDRKFKVFDRVNINGSYNFAADSLHFSQLNIAGNTFLFNMVNFDFRLVFDPYEADPTGRRVQQYVWDTRNIPVRFVTFDAGFSTRMDWRTFQSLVLRRDQPAGTGRAGGNSVPPVIESFNVNHNIRFNVAPIDGRDTFRITVNSLDLNGALNITPHWRFEVRNIGYDFSSKQITYPDITFYRDLHCWEMGMSWQPIRGTYSFYLRVKPSSLDFINIPYRKANYDPPNVF